MNNLRVLSFIFVLCTQTITSVTLKAVHDIGYTSQQNNGYVLKLFKFCFTTATLFTRNDYLIEQSCSYSGKYRFFKVPWIIILILNILYTSSTVVTIKSMQEKGKHINIYTCMMVSKEWRETVGERGYNTTMQKGEMK